MLQHAHWNSSKHFPKTAPLALQDNLNWDADALLADIGGGFFDGIASLIWSTGSIVIATSMLVNHEQGESCIFLTLSNSLWKVIVISA